MILWLPVEYSLIAILMYKSKWQSIKQRTKDSRWELIDGFPFIQFVPNIVISLSICLTVSIEVHMWLVIKILETVNQMNIWHTHIHTYMCASWKRQNKLLELKCIRALFELQSNTIYTRMYWYICWKKWCTKK